MLKKERLLRIVDKVNERGIITISDIMQDLNVSDMTIRRDLDELEKAGRLTRIHGGAQSLNSPLPTERSNSEKQGLQTNEKKEIALLAKQYVSDGDTIFIGPGTTLEAFAQQLKEYHIRIVTNSLPIFDILKECKTIDLIFLGGEYRPITGAFVGSITQKSIDNLSFSKTFVSANGISAMKMATYSESEGLIQRLALDKSIEKYLLIDSSKFDKFDFYNFYSIEKLDEIITDSHLSKEQFQKFSSHVTITRNS
ncbi:DeoR/GlpR family DNA-binding transcription regulator [Streptococcus hyovaginalis]|uniref:DeoR/GlpR family DNA-binding transcription regulator n=1 Tax=Streptococcus hyovaginalis TaxID=149015 RepID=UPI002A916B4A|nr:DeoR/GlpR family DNA-binding transcription regulator [Streptococcus hyovaginalis]MDY5973509.1 DeoR/GlpR family DNA-binding transcription regulator [Streptococcus hyovaginalis]